MHYNHDYTLCKRNRLPPIISILIVLVQHIHDVNERLHWGKIASSSIQWDFRSVFHDGDCVNYDYMATSTSCFTADAPRPSHVWWSYHM